MNVLPLLKTPMIDICKDIVAGELKEAEFEDLATVCKYIVPDGYHVQLSTYNINDQTMNRNLVSD